MRIAFIGVTGLVGGLAVQRLAKHELIVLTRRALRAPAANVRELVAPADAWPALIAHQRVQAAISTLGSTWRTAGSWEAFEAVDREAVVAFARAAHGAGATRMISVSSVGAILGSPNGYLALKGRMEEDLRQVGFDRLDILRPGLLRGTRGSDRRFGERLAISLSPLTNFLLRGRLDRFAAIDAAIVADAISALVDRPGSGVFVHHNREIRSLAKGDAPPMLR